MFFYREDAETVLSFSRNALATLQGTEAQTEKLGRGLLTSAEYNRVVRYLNALELICKKTLEEKIEARSEISICGLREFVEL